MDEVMLWWPELCHWWRFAVDPLFTKRISDGGGVKAYPGEGKHCRIAVPGSEVGSGFDLLS